MDRIKKAQKLITQYKHGSLEIGNLNYKLPYFDFINLGYMYLHGVTASNPSLMEKNNKGTFVPDFINDLNKLNEQTRIDFKELGFLVDHTSAIAEFIVKAGNRKTLTDDNDWTDVSEDTTDDANWYGSGYKMIYEVKGVQKHKNLDPWEIYWDLTNFKKSDKGTIITKKVSEIVKNEDYNKEARESLESLYDGKLDTYINLVQVVDNEELYIVDILNELEFLVTKRPKTLKYFKYDHEKRRGFPDAPGRGVFEKIFNVILQNKKARERFEEVQAITSTILYEKLVTDKKKEKLANKQVQKIKSGMIIPKSVPEKILTPVELGGHAQLAELQAKIVDTQQLQGKMLGITDVLQGDAKSLGANSSGKAIISLAEYASSVHKDVKKRYARVVEREYRDTTAPYILKMFDSTDNIKKYLTPVEWNIVKRNIVNYELAILQAVNASENKPFDFVAEKKKIEGELERKDIITEEILEILRGDVKGIKIIVSGEKASRDARNDFYSQIRAEALQDETVLQKPWYIATIKKQGKIYGIDELEIDEFINSI